MRMAWFRKLVLPKKETKGFPSFINKTDETRIQNVPFYLNMDREWVATEKVDGQSGTFTLERIKSKRPWGKDKFDFAVCSRNLRLWNEDDSTYWTVAKKYNIEILENNFRSLMILKNRYGDCDVEIGMNFFGGINTFAELPKPDEIYDYDNYTVFGWMRNHLKLTGPQLSLFAIIYGVTQNGMGVFHGGSDYFMSFLGITEEEADSALNQLVYDKLIKRFRMRIDGEEKTCYQIEEKFW